MCSPYLNATIKARCMEHEQWVAWLEDILWVLYELLNQYVCASQIGLAC